MKNWIKGWSQFFWPEKCLACGRQQVDLLCRECFDRGGLAEECRYRQTESGLSVYSLGKAEGPWKKVIHGLKYNGQFKWANRLMKRITPSPLPFDLSDEILMWVPVPLHHSRLRERGYNQSERIARCCAELWGGSVETRLLKRTRPSVSQTKLSATERKENVATRFQAVAQSLFRRTRKGRAVLVDDVMTTGSTLENCRDALLSCGVTVVGAVTLLRADLTEDDFESERWGGERSGG